MLLLTNYREKGNFITFPCIIQEKVDGVRCLIRNGKGISRSGKEISNINHILSELHTSDQLDGELWCESMTLYQISGLLNKKKLNKTDEKKILQIQFYVFDIKKPGIFKERVDYLHKLKSTHNFKNIHFIENIVSPNEEHAINLFENWIKYGKEGGVLRNLKGIYTNGRTTDVQKYKSRFDEEFKIVGIEYSDTGYLLYKCITENDFTFFVKNTIDCLVNQQNIIGKLLTVQFMSKDPITCIPREAVCLTIKN